MSVNLAPDKYLIVYYSVGGNTKKVASLIESKIESSGQECEVLVLDSKNNLEAINIESYKLIFLGAPTYRKGNCPKPVLELLRYLLKYNNFSLPPFSVFGTGETQWGEAMYCRAVDEMKYHLSKKTSVVGSLKIEQYPVSKYQINKVSEFVEQSLQEVN